MNCKKSVVIRLKPVLVVVHAVINFTQICRHMCHNQGKYNHYFVLRKAVTDLIPLLRIHIFWNVQLIREEN